MTITTGTTDTQTEHSQPRAIAGVAVAVSVPALLAIIGLFAMGFGAISWGGAIIWGVLAALVMWMFMAMGRAMGMTEMNLLDMMGSIYTQPGTSTSKGIGMGIHLVTGASLAISWAYTMALFAWPATWLSGMLWGGFVSLLAILLFSSMGVLHPKIRSGEQNDPGLAGMNLGRATPAGVVMAHLVYGLVLGGLYQVAPLV